MKTQKLFAAFAVVAIVLMAGCKKDDFVETIGVCPIVVSTIPANLATGVPVGQIIYVTFNEKMNPATINQASFSLSLGTTKISGILTYDGTTPTFSFAPGAPLAYSTTYTGRVTTLAKDMAGNALQQDYVWTFTTEAQQYTVLLSSNPPAGGTTTGGGSYISGTSVTVAATPNTGFSFISWTEGTNVVSTNTNYTFSITGNRTLVANFTAIINSYTLTLSSNPPAGGTTTGSGAYNSGTSVTASATANSGFTFTNWTEGVNVVSTNANYSFIITGNRTLVANFTEIVRMYLLNVTAVNGTVTKNPDEAAYSAGTSVLLTATPNPGYTFTGWSVDATGSANPLTVIMNSDKNITANFTAIVVTYTLSLSSNPLAGGTTTGAGTYNAGTSVTAAANANTGFTFTNWTEGVNVVSTDANYTFNLTGNRTLVANFTGIVRMYVLNVSAVNGTVTKNPDEAAYSSGTSVLLTATPNPGYIFTGWSVDATGSTNPLTVIMNSDKNITANFTAIVITYTLSLSSNPLAGGTTTGAGVYNEGVSVTAAATPNIGFTFTNWTEGVDVISTDANYSFNITGNRSLVANFTAIVNSYLVTLTSNPPAGGTTTGAGAYLSGASVTIGAVPNMGYTFTNWTEGVNVVSTDANYTFTISGHRTLVANFTEIVRMYVLNVTAVNGSVTKNPDEAAYSSGTSVLLTATPNPGYTFTGWSGDATGSGNPLTVIMNSDKNITANFTAVVITYTLSLSSNPLAGGTTIGAGTYNAGATATASALPNNGFTFTNWTEGVNVVSTDVNYTFNMTGNRTLVANFTAIVITYNLSLSSNPLAGGTTSGGGIYNSGTSVTATAAPNTGFTFTNWTEGVSIVSTNANYTFNITGNRTLVANFTAIINSYLVTLSSNPPLGGITTGAGAYNSGASVTIGAVPNSGYTFTNWTEGVNVVSTNASYTFNIAGNRTLVANFTAIVVTYTVVLSSNPLLGGTTTGAGVYVSGASVTVAALTNIGYSFTNWTEGVNVVSTNASYTFNIAANRSLVANFTAIVNSYLVTLTSNPPLGGITTGAGTYNSGASVTVGAVANSGFTFNNWTEGVTIVSSNANYTFNITGNRSLVANFTSDPVGPGPVNFGSAGVFAILTKSGISTTGLTSITGDIGVSPAAATAITGFTLIMDATNQFSTSIYVAGRAYAADYAVPTPAKMTTAVSDMETAYTTAMGLTVPAPVVELYAGDISGKTLAPGLYKWSTGLLISGAGVTLAGGPDDTWVFQIAQNMTVGSNAIVTLAGGAQAKNITWVVAGQANLGTGAVVNGNILSKTMISLNLGATVNGRLLAQTAVTLIGSTVKLP